MQIAHMHHYLSQRLHTLAHCNSMVQRRKLSDADRGRAVALLQTGFTFKNVAIRLGVSPSVIFRLKQRFLATGRVKERPRSGCPRSTDARADRFIIRQALTSWTNTAKRIRSVLWVTNNLNISVQTVRNRLRAAGLASRVAARRPRHTPAHRAAHRAARRAWSAVRVRWTRQQWSQVLFSDESKFNLLNSDRRMRVWRPAGERFNQDCIQQVTAHGWGSVMV